MMEDWRYGGFGLYVHWPFCASKCPYCDFNSHVARKIDESRWISAYRSEIARLGVETPGRLLNTIFFGGGTPSLMSPDLVAKVIEAARAAWPTANDLEVTLEANPTSVEAGRFRGYRDAGVNRLSMGVQALDDSHLKRLGRLHTAAEARAAFDIARNCFDRVSFDLIYARQHQTLPAWRTELTEALSMAVDHLSLYQLTIEDGTAFGARAAINHLGGLPHDDLAADLYAATQELTEAAGMAAYEVSNHAKTNAESRHNLIYWRYGDYAGIGPGAHGRLTLNGTRHASDTPKVPEEWLRRIEAQGHGENARIALSPADEAAEYLMMSLRLSEGSDLARYTRLAGAAMDSGRISGLQEIGMVKLRDGRLMATPGGCMVLNAVIRELMV